MAIITEEGPIVTTFQEYVDLLNRAAVVAFGSDFDQEGDSPWGQLAGILAEVFVLVDEGIVQSWAATDPKTATGQSLDNLLELFNIEREDGETDADYWFRAQKIRGLQGHGSSATLRAYLQAIDNVRRAKIITNTGTVNRTVSAVTIVPGAIAIAVDFFEAPDAEDKMAVGSTIFEQRPLGARVVGSESSGVTDDGGTDIKYIPAVARDLKITIDATLYTPRSTTIETDIREGLYYAVNSLLIGEDISEERVRAIVYQNRGIEVTDVAKTTAANGQWLAVGEVDAVNLSRTNIELNLTEA